jgi:phospholipid/cholesterol/gamma-HCH transport system substrate-binding protein
VTAEPRRSSGGTRPGSKTVRKRETAETLDRSVKDVSAAARETIGLIKDMAAENRDSLKLSLERIKDLVGRMEKSLELLNSSLEKINRGEGTLGKVIQTPSSIRNGRGHR